MDCQGIVLQNRDRHLLRELSIMKVGAMALLFAAAQDSSNQKR
jgi:hypothetical protein